MIKINSVRKINGYYEADLLITQDMTPTILAITNLEYSAKRYFNEYNISSIDATKIYFNRTISFIDVIEMKSIIMALDIEYYNKLQLFSIDDVDELVGWTWNGIEFIYI